MAEMSALLSSSDCAGLQQTVVQRSRAVVEPDTPPLGKVESCICSTDTLIEVGVNRVDVRVQPYRTCHPRRVSINARYAKSTNIRRTKTHRKNTEVSTRPPGDPRDAASADLSHGYGDC